MSKYGEDTSSRVKDKENRLTPRGEEEKRNL